MAFSLSSGGNSPVFPGFDHNLFGQEDLNVTDSSHIQPSGSNRPQIPINSTLRSTDLGTVVIIQPSSKNLLSNPVAVAKALKNSPFGKHKMKDIRTNKRKNFIVSELETYDPQVIKELIEVTKLGEWEVQCFQPKNDMGKSGVFGPLSLEASLADLKEHIQIKSLNNEGEIPEIISLDRLKRKTDEGWVDSACIKITFNCKVLPEAISIFHSFYKLRPYVAEPLQCYKCQRYGHTSTSCKAMERCLLCSGNHSKSNCPNSRLPNNFRCANCKGAHKANSISCELFSKAKEIENVRAKSNKTYVEARKEVTDRMNIKNFPQMNINRSALNPNQTTISQVQNRPNETLPSYRDVAVAVAGPSRYALPGSNSSQNQIIPSSGGCHSSKTINALNVEENTYPTDYFILKLKECLSQILESYVLKDRNTTKENIIDKVVTKTFTDRKTSNDKSTNDDSRGQIRQRENTDLFLDISSKKPNDSDTTNTKKSQDKPDPKKKKDDKKPSISTKTVSSKNTKTPNGK